VSVDPASWQPGTIIVNRDGTQAVTLVARQDKPRWYVIGRGLDGTDRWWMLDAELAESWQPLADVVARGWEQRQEVPEQWCLTHAATKWASKRECSSRYFGGNQGEPCRLVSLSYPITEGNNE
jgi:hypothetical protein